jgi:hypothetical protein
MSEKLNINPFEGIAPAPEMYHKMFADVEKSFKIEVKGESTFLDKIKSKSFRFPKQAMLYAA